jgi:UDP-N-acetylglucosamine 2-epimerase
MTKVHNPYGDGRACERIGSAIEKYLSQSLAMAV